MERFTKSIRSSVKNKDWYVALSSALTLPDVCGRLIDPDQKNIGVRYSSWFDKWVSINYKTYTPGVGIQTFLNGWDCYALRCSYLHEGGGDITQQKARKALDDFHFIVPPNNGNTVHCNKINNTLQLQVDKFCKEMADAVDKWSDAVKDDEAIQDRMRSLLKIHDWVPMISY